MIIRLQCLCVALVVLIAAILKPSEVKRLMMDANAEARRHEQQMLLDKVHFKFGMNVTECTACGGRGIIEDKEKV